MEELLKQAKLKALRLLTDMDRTEGQLREKLKQKEFPEDIIEQAIDYVKSFGYIDDNNYAKKYIESKKHGKSKTEMLATLAQKGLNRDLIDEAMKECYGDEDELQAIQALVAKKHFHPEDSSEEEKRKLMAYLVRKGFRYENVRKVVEVSSWNA